MEVTICKHSCRQLLFAFSIVHHPLHGHRGPPATPRSLAHAPAAPSRAFTDSQIIYGRVRAGAPLNVLLRKPLMREKAPFLPLLSNTVLWDNIGHYEVWGIFHGTL